MIRSEVVRPVAVVVVFPSASVKTTEYVAADFAVVGSPEIAQLVGSNERPRGSAGVTTQAGDKAEPVINVPDVQVTVRETVLPTRYPPAAGEYEQPVKVAAIASRAHRSIQSQRMMG